MILLALAARTIGQWLRRAIVALAQTAPQSNRDVPPEYYRFPLF